jgi:pilus assembly protein CpaB
MDRQKIIMIFGGAWLSAALLTWFVFSRTTSAKTEKMVQVIAAAQDLPAGTRLKKSDIKRIPIPEKDAPKLAASMEASVIDRVLVHPLSAGETIVISKLVASTGAEGISAMIQPGMRAVAVPIKDDSSAGGLIQPRSRVDVLFTRTGSMKEALTSNIIQDVMVLSIGRIVEANDPKIAQQNTQQSRAATLMVTPEQAAKLELAKNQGKVSLVLRNPLDKEAVTMTSATAEALDPDIFAGATRAMKRNMSSGAIPNVRDDKVWAQLTGTAPGEQPGVGPDGQPLSPKLEKKEPPKPRFVVDVYRGDKHVQEIFQ